MSTALPHTSTSIKKIVLIDDEDIIHMSFSLNIRSSGFNLISINNPNSAIEYSESSSDPEKPDIIFVDLMMQHVLGTDVIKIMRTREYFNNIPIILYTGYDYTKEYGKLVKSLNIAEVLTKPSTKETLLACIGRYLGV